MSAIAAERAEALTQQPHDEQLKFDPSEMFPDENKVSMEGRIDELETDLTERDEREVRHLARITELEEQLAGRTARERERCESLSADVTRWMTKLLIVGRTMGLKDFDEDDINKAAAEYREIVVLLGGPDVNPLVEIMQLRADLVKALKKP